MQVASSNDRGDIDTSILSLVAGGSIDLLKSSVDGESMSIVALPLEEEPASSLENDASLLCFPLLSFSLFGVRRTSRGRHRLSTSRDGGYGLYTQPTLPLKGPLFKSIQHVTGRCKILGHYICKRQKKDH
ncbi:hypothetical protein VNO80_01462 [Phaseolus coccineus]|uniref:Uncharacterized protein n=1 Tax=Phaseolus coccineus TaxID=3886 RepID=A0AAN9WWR3_PHACN